MCSLCGLLIVDNKQGFSIQYKHIHFIEIGDSLQSSLAFYLLQSGKDITGSDNNENDKILELQHSGAAISIGDINFIPEGTNLFVYPDGMKSSNPHRKLATEIGLDQYSSTQLLVKIAKDYDYIIAVCGSHGKSTVVSMIAHVLRLCGKRPDYIMAGTPVGGMPSAEKGNGKVFITAFRECEELLELNPNVGVIVNLDKDTKNTEYYREFCRKSSNLVCCDSANIQNLANNHPEVKYLNPQKDHFETYMLGTHNKYNASLAFWASSYLAIDEELIKNALRSFQGLERRCRIQSTGDKHIILEDFAHHPSELKVLTSMLDELYPKKYKILIFQPHSKDIVDKYREVIRESYNDCNSIFVTAPYTPEKNKKPIVQKLSNIKSNYLLPHYWEDLAEKVANFDQDTVYAIVGSKSIHKLIPVLSNLLRRQEIVIALPNIEIDTAYIFCDQESNSLGNCYPLIVSPRNEEEMIGVIKYCHRNQINITTYNSYFHPANLSRYNGVVIRLDKAFANIHKNGHEFTIGSGVILSQLFSKFPELNPKGELYKDSSIGGAIRMNIEYLDSEIGDYVTSVRGITSKGEIWEESGHDIEWYYKGSSVPIDLTITTIKLKSYL